MSVWAKVLEASDMERQAAAWGVQDMQRGNTESARSFFELAAKHRAVAHEFRATGQELEDLHAERLAELRRRVGILDQPRK